MAPAARNAVIAVTFYEGNASYLLNMLGLKE
jgi:hypothetical protein